MNAKKQAVEVLINEESDLAWELVHAVPGRSRYRIYALRQNQEMGARLGLRLRREKKIQRLQVRWQTGSLIIEHDPLETISAEELNRWLEDSEHLVLSGEADEGTPALQEGEGRLELTEPTAALDSSWAGMDKAGLFQRLEIAPEIGVLPEGVTDRRLRFGSNQVEEVKPGSRWVLFKRQFNNSQTGLLAGAAALSLMSGGVFDLLMIGGVLVANAYIGYLSEAHAEEVIYSIGKVEPTEVQVIRGGQRLAIFDHELVVGDLIQLGSGMVPADIRLIESKGLMVDESPLTGESMPVAKFADAIDASRIHTISDFKNTVFRGSIITSGQGLGLVVATGDQTKIGEVRRLVASTVPRTSTLERDLEDIGRQTIVFSGLVCGGVFLAGLTRGHGWLELLKTSISLAVAAVPEGLPTIGTTTMALGVSNLRKRNVLVRRLNVMEMLGSVQVLCLDKTGTLTLNEMVAVEGSFGLQGWTADKLVARTHKKDMPRTTEQITARTWSMVASLCNDCEWLPAVNGDPARWSGSATEKALIELVVAMGGDPLALKQTFPRFKVSYRTEERHYMVTYHRREDGDKNLAAVKGSPEQLLELCDWYLDMGEVKSLDAETRTRLLEQNHVMGKKGLRVLGFAYLEGQDLKTIQDKKLIWIGLVGLMDPMREGMAELISLFHKAGIKTIMMTGDQSSTAKAVGKALGFGRDGQKVKTVDARRLQHLSLDEIAEIADNTQVFSRVSPSDKLRIVQALQKKGLIVAMTGDGINDSPALKAAHVGIAMGFQGTSAARESADIVLKDDNLQIIFHAIEHGRAIHLNLRKSIKYLLATNLSEILLMLGSVSSGKKAALNAMQLLWINLLSDVLPGLALALDPPAKHAMRQDPPDPEAAILPSETKKQLLIEGGLMAAASFYAHRREGDSETAGTVAFVTLTTAQILHTLSASADQVGILKGGWPQNKRLYGAMGLAAGTLAVGTLLPWFRQLLGTSPLSGKQWFDALLQGISPLVINEALTSLKAPSLNAVAR